MKLDIKEMIAGQLTRLRYVVRFSTCKIQQPESVAEHSYYVAVYAMFIADWVRGKLPGAVIDDSKLLRGALMHDIEEGRTGDMPRYFKHEDAELHAKLEAAGARGAIEMLGQLTDAQAIRDRYFNCWGQAKDESTEGRIVAFADFLSVLGYVYEEVRGSNLTIQEHLVSIRDYAGSFDTADFDFIRELVTEAQRMLFEEIQL